MNFSLIICTRNRYHVLVENLRNNLAEFGPNDEILIVDSSDKDNFESLMGTFNMENIFYYHTDPGLPRQRNYGIQRATKDFIIFLDDDVCLDKNTINEARNFFKNNLYVDAITGALTEKTLPSSLTRFFEKVFGKIFFTSYFGYSNLTKSGLPIIPLNNLPIHSALFLRGGFSIYKSHVFKKINYDEYFSGYAYLEDTDFSLSFSKYFTAMYCPKFKGFHSHLSTNNKNFGHSRQQYVENYAYIYNKHRLGGKSKFYWTLFGLTFINLIKSIIECNFSYFTGTIKGLLICISRRVDKRP